MVRHGAYRRPTDQIHLVQTAWLGLGVFKTPAAGRVNSPMPTTVADQKSMAALWHA